MISNSSGIAPDLIQAYLETHYFVGGNLPMTLQIGLFSSALATLHKTFHVDCSVFITACNPFSSVVDDDINIARQALLKQDLFEQGLIFIDGVGRHPSGNWPGEPSIFVLGLG